MEKSLTKKIEVLPRGKSLAKNRYSLARKRYRFCQEKIEKVGKGLVVSLLGLGFRLRRRSVA
jgi:hypothetical protein